MLPCGIVAVAMTAGCEPPGARSPASAAEGLLCPELGANVDPLEASFSDDPSADARIRSFVAAARGLNDVTIEIEKLAVEACAHIRRDLGAPEVPAGARLDVQCEPLRTLLARLVQQGVQVRISVAAPRCEPDTTRKARCESVVRAGAGPESQALCLAESAVYARCSLPAISFAGSTNAVEVVRLGATLEKNLPAFVYAQMALALRLVEHAQAIATASARLPAELKDAGPHGLACVAVGAKVTATSADRLASFVSVSAALMAGLDPEIRAGGAP
jgi:hypothetical protein